MAERPEKTSRKSVTLPDRLWEAINEYRFSQRIGTEAEALRRLIQMGLDAVERGQAKRPARSRDE